jgi:hypothetical protein
MGDHKSVDMIPQLLPHGYRIGVQMQLQVVPKENVLALPAEKVRAAEDGSIEVLVGQPEAWCKPPAGIDVVELGTPLPPEKCDVAVILGTMVEDVLGPKLLAPGGRQAQGRVVSAPLAILARAPLVEWQAQHLGALRGVVE